MIATTVSEAKLHLADLIVRALAGEEIVIAVDSEAQVRLAPACSAGNRQFGSLKGVISVDERFFEPLCPAELAAWGVA